MATVFLALAANEDARPIIEAVMQDNPGAVLDEQPAMVKIDCEKRLTVRRSTVEELLGRAFSLQEIHLHLISLSGNIDESDDEFTLYWRN